MDAKAASAVVVRQERRGDVLVLAMAERPVNALSQGLRAGLVDGLKAAEAADVRAVVICSDIAQFSAGLDVSDPEEHDAKPSLADLCLQVEQLNKPVVTAINGSALGGGMELALAAHGRVAHEAARLGCPEVSLGLVPKAGSMQRLARLVGAQAALKLLLEPGPVTAAQALAIGLVDAVVATDLRESACALAEDLSARPLRKACDRRDGFRDPRAFQAAIAAARAMQMPAHLPAAARAIDCVEAAQLLAFEQGLAFEALAYAELRATAQAQGLRHALLAEQKAGQPPRAVLSLPPPPLATLAIWGGGAAAAEVAVQALTRGLRVLLVEPQRDVLVKTVEEIAARQDMAVAEGRLSEAARDADWARLVSTMAASGLAGADLVLTATEAGPLPVVPAAPVLPLGALPARAAAGKLALNPAVAAGLPAEVGFTEGADPQTMALALALARRLGWRLIFTGAGGPIDKRLRAALSAAIAGLEAEGLARETIAAALAAFGIGVGPRAALPKAPAEASKVVSACLDALAAQGARLLGEGVARRACDIDAVAVMAGIFPRWQGGPMFWADQRGLLVLRSDLRHRAETAPQIYAPDPIFDRLIAEGRRFASLDAIGG